MCEELEVESIDILHVDAQGSDLDVLVSAGELLQTVRAGVLEGGRRLNLYANTATRWEILRFLMANGFRVARVRPADRFNFEQNIFFTSSPNQRPILARVWAITQSVRGDAEYLTSLLGRRTLRWRLAFKARTRRGHARWR